MNKIYKACICVVSYIRLRIKMMVSMKRESCTNGNTIVLLNTEMGSDNLGDNIIMMRCREVINHVLGSQSIVEIATHKPATNKEIDVMKRAKAVIVCGTNFLAPKMELKTVWRYSEDMVNIPNMVTLAVGGGGVRAVFPIHKAVLQKIIKQQFCPFS